MIIFGKITQFKVMRGNDRQMSRSCKLPNHCLCSDDPVCRVGPLEDFIDQTQHRPIVLSIFYHLFNPQDLCIEGGNAMADIICHAHGCKQPHLCRPHRLRTDRCSRTGKHQIDTDTP